MLLLFFFSGAAGCAYENVLAVGASAVTYSSAPDSVPSPSGGFGLDLEWCQLFGVSSFLSDGESLVSVHVAPDLGQSRSTLVRRAGAPDTFYTVRPVAGWWSWPRAPEGSGVLAGFRLALGVTPHDPLGRAETLLFEYGFLWLFGVEGAHAARLQTVRVAYVCGF